jgi:acetylornithine deacetylase/succinyl-diaminopimelate desuccinylase-like protein
MREVYSYIDEHVDQFVEDLKKFCRQPSISAQGVGIDKCANLLEEMMKESGLDSKIITVEGGKPVVFGEIKVEKTASTLGFYNHYDVQPPEPIDMWLSPPFSAEERDGRIYARGVPDNKGNIIARLKAVEAILNTLGRIPVNIKLFAEGEEEIGSPHLLKFVKENKNILAADSYIWEGGYKDPNDRPEIYLGVKGILYVEMKARGANSDLHSGRWAKLVANPAWRLLWALNSLKNQKEQILIPGFYDDVAEPSEEELSVLSEVRFEEERIKSVFGIKERLGGKSGFNALKSHIFEPSCNICGLDSGYTGLGSKTVLPRRAMAKVDFRLISGQDPDDILKKLRKHLKDNGFGDIIVEKLGGSYPSAKTSPKENIVKIVLNTAREVYCKEPILTWVTGSSPVYTVRNTLKTPVVFTGVDHFYNNIHAPNENLRIREDFIQGIKHMAAIILNFGKN